MKDTIVALATPPGISGIAVIRLSGEESIKIADSCFYGRNKLIDSATHTIHYGSILNKNRLIDTVTASIFKGPNSYTGENTIEISCHGGYIVADEIINLLIVQGARPATAGEFTKRAFLNGKLDLTQVEAVADIIHSASVPACQTAARQLAGGFTEKLEKLRKQLVDISSLLELELDFADEGLEFVDRTQIVKKINETKSYCLDLASLYKASEILRSGFHVGIAGLPNSGKSTLFNALLNKKRAIVSDIPGTTRDYIEEVLYINNIPVKLIDMAGIRETKDVIEIEGIRFVDSLLEQSNLVFLINDISISEDNSHILYNNLLQKYPETGIILLQNKIDKVNREYNSTDDIIYISAKNRKGIEELKRIIEKTLMETTSGISDTLINQRHAFLLNHAAASLAEALEAIENQMENEVISIDIRNAIRVLGEITGETWSEDILNNIFSKFCIGK